MRESLQVMTDLAAAVFGDAHGGGRRRDAGRQQSGTEQQAPNTHTPVPVTDAPPLRRVRVNTT